MTCLEMLTSYNHLTQSEVLHVKDRALQLFELFSKAQKQFITSQKATVSQQLGSENLHPLQKSAHSKIGGNHE